MVIPVTRADMHIDKLDEAYNPVGEKDGEIWKSCMFYPTGKAREFLLTQSYQMTLNCTMEPLLLFKFNVDG